MRNAFLTSKLQDTRTWIKVYLLLGYVHLWIKFSIWIRDCITVHTAGISPKAWGSRIEVVWSVFQCIKRLSINFFFFSRKHSKELFTGAEVVLDPFCFLLDILIVLVNNHLTSLTRCTWTASTWGWCSWTAVPGRAACRRTGCGGKTHDTTTCSNGTWNPSGHVLGGRRPGSEGLRAGSAAPFHTILSPLSLLGFLFLSVVTLSNMYACPHRSKKKTNQDKYHLF